MDSLPVPVCDNYYICRSRLCPRHKHSEAFQVYIPSKQRSFYGLRMHLVMIITGLPDKLMVAPGSEADITAFRRLGLGLPEEARVFADANYLNQREVTLFQDAGLHLAAWHRKNSRQPLTLWVAYLGRRNCKCIETAFN